MLGRIIALVTGVLMCMGIACAAEPDPSGAKTGKPVYVVGITPQFEARKLYETWRPILDALEKSTGLAFTLRGASSISDFEQQYAAGMFDFAYANPYFVGVRNYQGYLPLARDHGNNLVGVVVVQKGGAIRTLQDLDGQTVAFPAANSLAGCLVIRAQLEDEAGVRVLPRYVRTHDSSYLNVAVGAVVAAGGVKATLDMQAPEIRDRLRVLFTTRELPSLPVVAHPRVPEEVRRHVQSALLKLGGTPEGKAMLERVPIKQIGTATLADYEPLRRMRLDRYEN